MRYIVYIYMMYLDYIKSEIIKYFTLAISTFLAAEVQ